MKKKFLSVLLSLAMLLTLLPASALAADLTDEQKDALADQGYTQQQIDDAVCIDVDTDLTEDVEGLVIVVAPVKVTINGAKLATGILVAPGAKGASVTLGDDADVNAVIVMDTADVTVAETATAVSVTVTAAEATVTVAGTVTALNVAETAESAVVTVAETAKVKTVEVAAPEAKVEVSGTVEAVTVAETAAGAELAVAETATVSDVTDATGKLAVTGSGAASVTVTDTTTPAEEPTQEEPAQEEPAPATPTEVVDEVVNTNPFVASEGPAFNSEPVHETTAPGEDVEPDDTTAPHASATGGITKVAPLGADTAKDYAVSTFNVTTSYADDADAVYSVTIRAKDVQVTTSSSALGNAGKVGFDANWVGISIPVDTTSGYTYKFYTLTRWDGNMTAADLNDNVFNTPADKTAYVVKSDFGTSANPIAPGLVDWTDEATGQDYHTVYFPASSALKNDTTYWAVGMEVYEAGADKPVWTEIYDIQLGLIWPEA